MDDNHEPIDKSELLKNLTGRFSLEELKTLAFRVGVHSDDIAGETRSEKARELIDYLDRHGRLEELVAAAAKACPDANWPSVPAAELLLAMPLDEVPAVAALPPGSRMPLVRNPLFVGRQADLMAVARTLQGAETASIGQVAVATGLGGIGKTQLASEFAHRYGQYFAGGVFWPTRPPFPPR